MIQAQPCIHSLPSQKPLLPRDDQQRESAETEVRNGHRIVTFDNEFVTLATRAFDRFDNLADNDILEVIEDMKQFRKRFFQIIKRGY